MLQALEAELDLITLTLREWEVTDVFLAACRWVEIRFVSLYEKITLSFLYRFVREDVRQRRHEEDTTRLQRKQVAHKS